MYKDGYNGCIANNSDVYDNNYFNFGELHIAQENVMETLSLVRV